MSDPVRLLDMEGDAASRAILRSGLDDGPPPGARDDIFRALEVAIGATAIGVAGTAGAATQSAVATAGTGAANAGAAGAANAGAANVGASTALKVGGLKAFIVKLGIVKTVGILGLSTGAIVGTTVGVQHALRPSAPAAVDTAKTAPVALVTHSATKTANAGQPSRFAPSTPAIADSADPEPSAAEAPAPPASAAPGADARSAHPTHPDAPAASEAHSHDAPPEAVTVAPVASSPQLGTTIADESASLSDVRAKLKSGDASGALAELQEMQKRYGAGHLSQDRTVLTIEALAASGHADAARANADAFLAANPSSPFAARVRPYATPDPNARRSPSTSDTSQ